MWAGAHMSGAPAPVERYVMNTSKKTFAIVASATAAVLVGGGVAVAYWTTTGSGSGSATAGTTTAFTIAQTNAVTGLYPGGPAANLSISVTNPGSSSAQITTVTAVASATDQPGCDAADFDVTVNAIPTTTIAPAASVPFANVATVALTNTSSEPGRVQERGRDDRLHGQLTTAPLDAHGRGGPTSPPRSGSGVGSPHVPRRVRTP